MATYYRVGGKSTRYDTLAAANRRASSIFARTGVVASVTEHTTRDRGTPPTGTGDTPREPYRGEYYRAGSLPNTHAAHGAIVHRSPQHTGLFALVYGVKLNPIALVGPYACEQDAADNLAAWEIRLFRRLNAKHAIKADAERGKRMDTHRPGKVADIGRAAVVRRPKLERVK